MANIPQAHRDSSEQPIGWAARTGRVRNENTRLAKRPSPLRQCQGSSIGEEQILASERRSQRLGLSRTH